MDLPAELRHIRNAFLRIAGVFILLLLFFLTVSLPPLHGTVSEWVIERVRTDLIPRGATLAVMTPLDPFLAQAGVAAAVAVGVLIPIFLIELWRYVTPALRPRERRIFLGGLLVACLLALLGAAFSYFVLIPLMFKELYAFLPDGVAPLFNLRAILTQVAGFTLGTALIFLLPLAMALFTWVGIVKATIWRAQTRFVVLLVLIGSAIITPDGSGVGMMLLAVPICALYGLGYIGASVLEKRSPLNR